MNIVRFLNEDTSPSIGLWEDEHVYDLTAFDSDVFCDFLTMVEKAKEKGMTPAQLIEKAHVQEKAPVHNYSALHLLTPVDAAEVWACGVTYEKSRTARNKESATQRTEVSVYDKVYDAKRPELFMKSTASRTAAPDQYVCIRSDSTWQIPEPEVGLVINRKGDILGYTAGNDMSCRDIEGENPLYLPQAKVWRHSCSFGPSIRLADTVDDPYDLQIMCRIYRDHKQVFAGEANTSQLKRKFESLVEYLIRDNLIFDGTVLLTGTCIVPPDEFTLHVGDCIEIEVSGIGVLRNIVKDATFDHEQVSE